MEKWNDLADIQHALRANGAHCSCVAVANRDTWSLTIMEKNERETPQVSHTLQWRQRLYWSVAASTSSILLRKFIMHLVRRYIHRSLIGRVCAFVERKRWQYGSCTRTRKISIRFHLVRASEPNASTTTTTKKAKIIIDRILFMWPDMSYYR